MAETASTMIPLGTSAPQFTLIDTKTGGQVSLDELKSEVGTVVMFICNHCPFVKHVLPELVRLDDDYTPQGISFVAISSNDVNNYPDDSPEKMKSLADRLGFSFPYLYDETQEVARAYDAACTPDFFIFDQKMACVYRGQLDDSRPGSAIPLSGKDLREALEDLIAGNQVSADQKPSIGCNIKWR